MDLATLTSFFGWMAVINIVLLGFAGLMLMLGRPWISGVHGRMTGLSEERLNALYVTWLGNYKIAALTLSVVPWLALKLMG